MWQRDYLTIWNIDWVEENFFWNKLKGPVGKVRYQESKNDLAEINFISWLAPYKQSRTSDTNFPIDKSTTNGSTESCREEFDYEIESDGNDEDTFESENVSNSGYNETADVDTESVCSAAIVYRKKSPFKKHKKLPLKNSDMQKAERDFLRARKGECVSIFLRAIVL